MVFSRSSDSVSSVSVSTRRTHGRKNRRTASTSTSVHVTSGSSVVINGPSKARPPSERFYPIPTDLDLEAFLKKNYCHPSNVANNKERWTNLAKDYFSQCLSHVHSSSNPHGDLYHGGIGISSFLSMRLGDTLLLRDGASLNHKKYTQNALEAAQKAAFFCQSNPLLFQPVSSRHLGASSQRPTRQAARRLRHAVSLLQSEWVGSKCLAVAAYSRLGKLEQAKSTSESILRILDESCLVPATSALTSSFPSFDVLSGRAGALQAVLMLRQELHDPTFGTEFFVAQVMYLLKTGFETARNQSSSVELIWEDQNNPANMTRQKQQKQQPKFFLGTVHGTVGILHTILGMTQEEWKLLNDALPRAFEMVRLAIKSLATQVYKDSGNLKPTVNSTVPDRLVEWSHGAPGYCLLLLRAAQIFDSSHDEYIQQATELAHNVVWPRGLLTKGHGLAYGIAGNAYVFLALSRAKTGAESQMWKQRAMYYIHFSMESMSSLLEVPNRPYSLFGGLGALAMLCLDIQHEMPSESDEEESNPEFGVYFPLYPSASVPHPCTDSLRVQEILQTVASPSIEEKRRRQHDAIEAAKLERTSRREKANARRQRMEQEKARLTMTSIKQKSKRRPSPTRTARVSLPASSRTPRAMPPATESAASAPAAQFAQRPTPASTIPIEASSSPMAVSSSQISPISSQPSPSTTDPESSPGFQRNQLVTIKQRLDLSTPQKVRSPTSRMGVMNGSPKVASRSRSRRAVSNKPSSSKAVKVTAVATDISRTKRKPPVPRFQKIKANEIQDDANTKIALDATLKEEPTIAEVSKVDDTVARLIAKVPSPSPLENVVTSSQRPQWPILRPTSPAREIATSLVSTVLTKSESPRHASPLSARSSRSASSSQLLFEQTLRPTSPSQRRLSPSPRTSSMKNRPEPTSVAAFTGRQVSPDDRRSSSPRRSPTEERAEQTLEKQKELEERKRVSAEAATKKQEKEAKRKAEQLQKEKEEREQAKIELAKQRKEEVRRRSEEIARKKEERRLTQLVVTKKKEEEARRRAEKLAKDKAEEEARLLLENEVKRKADEEQARAQVALEAASKAKKEKDREEAADKIRIKAAEKARRFATQEQVKRRAKEEGRRLAEKLAKKQRQEEEEQLLKKREEQALAEAKLKAEEEEKLRIAEEKEAKRQAKEEERRLAQKLTKKRRQEEEEQLLKQRVEEALAEAKLEAEEEEKNRIAEEKEASRLSKEEDCRLAEELAQKQREEEEATLLQRLEEEAQAQANLKAEEEAKAKSMQEAQEEADRIIAEAETARLEKEAARRAAKEEEKRLRADQEAIVEAEERACRAAEQELSKLMEEEDLRHQSEELRLQNITADEQYLSEPIESLNSDCVDLPPPDLDLSGSILGETSSARTVQHKNIAKVGMIEDLQRASTSEVALVTDEIDILEQELNETATDLDNLVSFSVEESEQSPRKSKLDTKPFTAPRESIVEEDVKEQELSTPKTAPAPMLAETSPNKAPPMEVEFEPRTFEDEVEENMDYQSRGDESIEPQESALDEDEQARQEAESDAVAKIRAGVEEAFKRVEMEESHLHNPSGSDQSLPVAKTLDSVIEMGSCKDSKTSSKQKRRSREEKRSRSLEDLTIFAGNEVDTLISEEDDFVPESLKMFLNAANNLLSEQLESVLCADVENDHTFHGDSSALISTHYSEDSVIQSDSADASIHTMVQSPSRYSQLQQHNKVPRGEISKIPEKQQHDILPAQSEEPVEIEKTFSGTLKQLSESESMADTLDNSTGDIHIGEEGTYDDDDDDGRHIPDSLRNFVGNANKTLDDEFSGTMAVASTPTSKVQKSPPNETRQEQKHNENCRAIHTDNEAMSAQRLLAKNSVASKASSTEESAKLPNNVESDKIMRDKENAEIHQSRRENERKQQQQNRNQEEAAMAKKQAELPLPSKRGAAGAISNGAKCEPVHAPVLESTACNPSENAAAIGQAISELTIDELDLGKTAKYSDDSEDFVPESLRGVFAEADKAMQAELDSILGNDPSPKNDSSPSDAKDIGVVVDTTPDKVDMPNTDYIGGNNAVHSVEVHVDDNSVEMAASIGPSSREDHEFEIITRDNTPSFSESAHTTSNDLLPSMSIKESIEVTYSSDVQEMNFGGLDDAAVNDSNGIFQAQKLRAESTAKAAEVLTKMDAATPKNDDKKDESGGGLGNLFGFRGAKKSGSPHGKRNGRSNRAQVAPISTSGSADAAKVDISNGLTPKHGNVSSYNTGNQPKPKLMMDRLKMRPNQGC